MSDINIEYLKKRLQIKISRYEREILICYVKNEIAKLEITLNNLKQIIENEQSKTSNKSVS